MLDYRWWFRNPGDQLRLVVFVPNHLQVIINLRWLFGISETSTVPPVRLWKKNGLSVWVCLQSPCAFLKFCFYVAARCFYRVTCSEELWFWGNASSEGQYNMIVHTRKLTWQWKIPIFDKKKSTYSIYFFRCHIITIWKRNAYTSSSDSCFHCHVSFPGHNHTMSTQSHQENLSFKMAGIRALHTHMQRRWCIRGVRHFSKVGETLVIFWTNELQKRQPAHDLKVLTMKKVESLMDVFSEKNWLLM